MIRLLDESLEEMLRTEVPLPAADIDVAFDTPDDEWSNGITRPTVNAFLWDVRRSAKESRAGRITREEASGVSYQTVPPRVAFRYHLTTWAADVRDEHQILGAMLVALLPIRQMPQRYLTEPLRAPLPAPDLRVAAHDAKDFVDFWSAMEGKLKAGLDVVVTATVDSNLVLPAGPPVGTRRLEVAGLDGVAEVIEEVAGPAGTTERYSSRSV